MNIKELTLVDLKQLARRVETEITRRTEVMRKTLVKKFQKLAATEGLAFEELVGNNSSSPAAQKRGRKPGRPKTRATTTRQPFVYFHPEDPTKGWSGHGRKPNWYIEWVNAGKDPELLKNEPSKEIAQKVTPAKKSASKAPKASKKPTPAAEA